LPAGGHTDDVAGDERDQVGPQRSFEKRLEGGRDVGEIDVVRNSSPNRIMENAGRKFVIMPLRSRMKK
jgi:hypothetical protein